MFNWLFGNKLKTRIETLEFINANLETKNRLLEFTVSHLNEKYDWSINDLKVNQEIFIEALNELRKEIHYLKTDLLQANFLLLKNRGIKLATLQN
jgi:predicted nuclease with TOPRIM domain